MAHQREIRVLHVGELDLKNPAETYLEQETDQCTVETVPSANDGLSTIKDRPPDCIVLECDIEDMSAVEYIETVRDEHSDLPVILFTDNEDIVSDALAAGATDIVQKQSVPEQYELLARRVRNAVERYQTENRFCDLREEYTTLFENVENGLLLVDVEDEGFRYRKCNPRAAELIGRDREEIAGEQPSEALGPDNEKHVVGAYRKCIDTREPVEYIIAIDLPVGEVTRECKVTPVSTEGKIEQLVVAFHDITDRIRRQRELERYDRIIEKVPVGVFRTTPDGDLVSCNEQLVEIYNAKSSRELAAVNVESLYSDPGDRARLYSRLEATGTVEDERLRVETLDGELKWVETSIRLVKEGGDQYLDGVVEDVTAQVEREEELKAAETKITRLNRLHQTILSNMRETVLVTDEDGYFTYVCPNAHFIFGYDSEEVTDFGTIEALFDERLVESEALEERGEITNIETTITDSGGTERTVLVTVRQVDIESGTRLYSVREITERKEREKELEEWKQSVERALDTLDELFYVLDADGTLRRWNEQFPEVTGYAESELSDMHAIEVFPEDEQQTVTDSIEKVLEGDQVTVEADILTADGERKPYEFTGHQLTDANGNTIGLVGIGRDLTEIREQQHRFRALTEQSPDMISVVDAEARFQYVSPSWRQLGYEPEEVVGNTVWQYVHPEDRAELIEEFEAGLANPEMNPVVTFRVRHADGSWRWLEARGNNQLDNPAVEGYVVNKRDITERKEREAELLRKSRTLENAPVGVTVTDPNREDNPIIFANEKFESLTGYSESEACGRNHRHLQGKRTDPEPVAAMRDAIDKRERVSVELRNYRSDGTEFWNRVDIAPVFDEDGDLVNFVGFQQDVTERKLREQQIQVFNRILRHNLRNRLNIARAHIRRVAREHGASNSDRVLTESSTIDGTTFNPALNAIRDLIGLSQKSNELHRAMNMNTEREEIELSSYLSRLVADVQNAFPAASFSFEGSEEVVLSAFPSLRIAFEEILENAAKHAGQKPRISVAIERNAEQVAVQIRDNGQGLSKQNQRVLAKGAETPLMHGSGLGLWMVSWIVTSNGGSLDVDVSEDGTTVTVSLPQSSTDTTSVSVVSEPELQQARDRFETIFEESFDAMVITGPDGNYIEVNAAATELFSRTERQLLGSRLEELAKDLDRSDAKTAMDTGRERDQFTLVWPDGTERFVEYSVTPNIVPEQHLFVFRDATERKHREQALTARTEELERQNRRLNEFASVVSHDIRNPLNVATKQLEQARRECNSQHLATVADAHRRIDELIGDVLDLARAGQELGDIKSVQLTTAVAECWQTVEGKDASLAIETDCQIRADPSRFRQVVENLLRNAIEHGGDDVSITISQREDGDGFYVADDGDGIPDDEVDSIFESGYSTDDGGTGFGLAIVEEVVDAHGWSIQVSESQSGGARFDITNVSTV